MSLRETLSNRAVFIDPICSLQVVSRQTQVTLSSSKVQNINTVNMKNPTNKTWFADKTLSKVARTTRNETEMK